MKGAGVRADAPDRRVVGFRDAGADLPLDGRLDRPAVGPDRLGERDEGCETGTACIAEPVVEGVLGVEQRELQDLTRLFFRLRRAKEPPVRVLEVRDRALLCGRHALPAAKVQEADRRVRVRVPRLCMAPQFVPLAPPLVEPVASAGGEVEGV